MSPQDAPSALVALAESGCVLAAEGRLDELAALDEAWDAAMRALPRPVPQEARALVRQAARLQGEQAAILATARAQVAAELARLARGRTGVRGYVPAGVAAAGALDASA